MNYRKYKEAAVQAIRDNQGAVIPVPAREAPPPPFPAQEAHPPPTEIVLADNIGDMENLTPEEQKFVENLRLDETYESSLPSEDSWSSSVDEEQYKEDDDEEVDDDEEDVGDFNDLIQKKISDFNKEIIQIGELERSDFHGIKELLNRIFFDVELTPELKVALAYDLENQISSIKHGQDQLTLARKIFILKNIRQEIQIFRDALNNEPIFEEQSIQIN